MVQIIATVDQAKLFAESGETIEFVDVNGNRLGFFARAFSTEEVKSAKKRLVSTEPRLTHQQVMENLKTLENQ